VVFNTRTAINAYPTYNVAYCLAAGRADGGTPAELVLAEVVMTYWVEFSGPLAAYYS